MAEPMPQVKQQCRDILESPANVGGPLLKWPSMCQFAGRTTRPPGIAES